MAHDAAGFFVLRVPARASQWSVGNPPECRASAGFDRGTVSAPGPPQRPARAAQAPEIGALIVTACSPARLSRLDFALAVESMNRPPRPRFGAISRCGEPAHVDDWHSRPFAGAAGPTRGPRSWNGPGRR